MWNDEPSIYLVLVVSPIVMFTSYTQTSSCLKPPYIEKIPALRVPGPGAISGLMVILLLNGPLGMSSRYNH